MKNITRTYCQNRFSSKFYFATTIFFMFSSSICYAMNNDIKNQRNSLCFSINGMKIEAFEKIRTLLSFERCKDAEDIGIEGKGELIPADKENWNNEDGILLLFKIENKELIVLTETNNLLNKELIDFFNQCTLKRNLSINIDLNKYFSVKDLSSAGNLPWNSSKTSGRFLLGNKESSPGYWSRENNNYTSGSVYLKKKKRHPQSETMENLHQVLILNAAFPSNLNDPKEREIDTYLDGGLMFNSPIATLSVDVCIQVEDLLPINKEVRRHIHIERNKLGVAGLDMQVDTLMREVVLPIVDKENAQKFKVFPTKGILFYGPAGTGKSLIAGNLGKIIPNSITHVVNSAELHSKYYDRKVKDLFLRVKREHSKYHIIIFDELDAIGHQRTANKINRAEDRPLIQLLAEIDGINSAHNVIFVGTTNKARNLDKALILPGRFETHIEVPLPNAAGRKEILDMLLKGVRDAGFTENVDTNYWGDCLRYYSGADLKGLIAKAMRIVMAINYNQNGDTYDKKSSPLCVLNDEILREAYNDMNTEPMKADGL